MKTKQAKTVEAKPMTYAQILDRDVPAIVEYVKNWARQGVNGPVEIFYQHEVICGAFTALVHDPTDEGWIPATSPFQPIFPTALITTFCISAWGMCHSSPKPLTNFHKGEEQ